MKKTTRNILAIVLTAGILVSLGAGIAYAKSMADAERLSYMKTDSPMDGEPETVTVSKGANEAAGAGQTAGYSLLLDGDDWLLTDKEDSKRWSKAYKVTVPSSISGALYAAGAIKNPTVGRNDAAAKELGTRDWYYRKVFNYSGSGKNVYLCFDGVADRMEVTLNGRYIGYHQGMFGGPYFDVTDLIKTGENELVVRLKPVINYTQTVVFNCSYAWHYADLPPIGIWNSVRVEDRAAAALDSPFITTVSHETGTMNLCVDIADTEGSGAKIGGTLYCTVKPKNFDGSAYSFSYKLPEAEAGGARRIRLRFDLPEFKLWWPNGYGEQNLYTLETLFVDGKGGRSYDTSTFGVRTLDLIATGRKESANMYNRTAVFNGKTVFLKGADWCTIDAVMNFTREDYDRILCRAYDQGLNVFRSWGGGMCETDDFYDLCDEYGLCVYQEWPCCWDSQQTQPADVLYETVILNTKRIRNRASLLVYGGGNEGEAPTSDSIMNHIGKLTYQYDGTRDFWRQDGGVGANGIRHDHIHWGGEDPEHYADVYYDFTSNLHEYGLDSMMNLESIAKFATAKEMAQWPIDQLGTIAYHTATFNGMKGWQQTPYGYDIDTFIHYASQFVEVNSLESLVMGSQIAQTMADVPAAFNSRVNFPYQSMVMYYKFNDVYPGASWSVVDYYGAPKMAYWFLQDAYAPLTAGVKTDRYDTYNKTDRSLSLPVYILDDADELKNAGWEVTVTAYNGSLKTVKQERYTGSGSIDMKQKLGQFTLTEKETDTAPLFIVTTLYKNGTLAARTYMFMNAGKDPGCLFSIPAADVQYTVSGNTVTFVNNSDIPAAAVRFDVGSDSDTFRPSDNWFWLEPGESYAVTVNDASVIKGITGFNVIDASDKKAPSAPKNVKVKSESHDSLTVSWDKPKNSGDVRYYEIYLNGEFLTTAKGTATEYKIEGLTELTSYDVEVVAVDEGMNRSAASKKVTAETVADNVAAFVKNLVLTGPNSATVYFSRKIGPASASNTDCYLLNLGGKVAKAEPSADGMSADLTFEGVDGNFAGRTLTVVGLRDTSRSANPSKRSYFRLDGITVGRWTFDTESEVLEDESGYHLIPGSAVGASYEAGWSGLGIRPVKNTLLLTQTDLTLENTVISFMYKGGSYAGFNVLLSKGEKVSGHFEIYANEGQLKLYCPDICDSSFGVSLKKYSGKWVRMCFYYDGSGLVCMIDGKVAGTAKMKNDVPAADFELVLGSLPGGQMRTDALFDDLLIVKTENCEAVAKAIYEGTFFDELKFEKASYRLKPETSVKINATSDNASALEGLVWTSSDESVATVDAEGNVTAVADGSAFITAVSPDGRYAERCLVEVGDFKEEKKPGNGPDAFMIVAIALAAVAVLAVVAVVVIVIKRRKTS